MGELQERYVSTAFLHSCGLHQPLLRCMGHMACAHAAIAVYIHLTYVHARAYAAGLNEEEAREREPR